MPALVSLQSAVPQVPPSAKNPSPSLSVQVGEIEHEGDVEQK
jgi:hypothetical protein